MNAVENVPVDDPVVAGLRRGLQRLQLLTEAFAAMSAAVTPLQVADVAVAQFSRLLGTSSVAVFELRGPDSLDAMTLGGWVQGARDAWMTMPLDAPAPVADAARTRVPVWSESAAAWNECYPHLVGMLDGYGYRGVLGLPLVAGSELVGAVGIGFMDDRTLDADERAAVTALGVQCAQALLQARLLQVESDARRAAERLTAMVAALSRSRTLEQVTAAIGEAVVELGASSSLVAIRTGGDRLDLLSTTGGATQLGGLPLAAAHPLAHAVRTGEPVWLARRSELAWQGRSFISSPEVPTVDVAVPMYLDDRTVGAIGMAFSGEPPHYSPDQRRTIVTLAGQCAQALDRARLQQVEHDIADTLQRSLLPDRLPQLDRLALAARYLPGSEGTQAGGDWYDVVELGGSQVALVVGDVVGKGAAAAALMGQLRTALAVALLRGDGPAEALGQLDRFSARVPAARASTAACVLVDWETGLTRWASAGHPAPLLLTGDGGRLLDGDIGPVLGLPATGLARYFDQQGQLPLGATLVLYTDGLVERRDEHLDDGFARLATAAAGRADEPPALLAEALLQDLLDEQGPTDDVALLLARMMPPPWQAQIAADPAELRGLRRGVEGWSTVAALDGVQADDLQLALGEAVANAIEHAYRGRPPGAVDVAVERGAGGAVRVRVVDTGAWRPPPTDPGHRGRGLDVIRTVAAHVEVVPGSDGTCVAFVVPPAAVRDITPVPPHGGTRQPVDVVVTVVVGADEVRVVLAGEIDLAGAVDVRDRLHAMVDDAPEGCRIVLDLAGLDYVASAGVALLLDTAQRARGRGLTVDTTLRPDGPVARVLDITGVGTLLAATSGPARPEE